MEIVDHRVVTKRLNFCLHIEILVDFDLETAFHLLVVYFVFLAGQLFLLNLSSRYLWTYPTYIPTVSRLKFL